MTFTTRPDLTGTFGMVATTHWLATAVGLKLLEAGGTAADAAAGAGFALNVVEPHLNGPLGDMPAMVWPAGDDSPQVICGQGGAPAGATIEHYRDQGLTAIPGSGLLSAVVPGAFGAWMTLLRDHGRLSLRQILEPAIYYAETGHPLLPGAAQTIAGQAAFFEEEWPTSAKIWLQAGRAPKAGDMLRNPSLAQAWRRLLDEAEAVAGREAQIEAARRAFYSGFVADAIDRFVPEAALMDGAGARRRGVLTGADMAAWQASYEAPLTTQHAGWDVFKPGAWTQGPTLLLALNLLEAQGALPDDTRGGAFVHRAVEALKAGFADRDAYLADPAPGAAPVPVDHLMSRAYAAERAGALGEQAALDHVPGHIVGFEAAAQGLRSRLARGVSADRGPGGGEPTMAHLDKGPNEGDTVHIDVIDQWGNAVSATPSGGWLQSNPVIPGLGMALNTRAQMFWLDHDVPGALAPGRRPRTTLSPSMARAPDGTRLAFGTPGGDRQDQWQLAFLLRVIHHGATLQQAIDAPQFLTDHLEASFAPRAFRPGHLTVEPAFPAETIADLRARGHDLEIAAPMSIGRMCAAGRRPDGLLTGAATPRLMQAYAMGR